MPQPVIRPDEAAALRAAAEALRAIWARGFVDYVLPHATFKAEAAALDAFVDIYEGCLEAPDR